MRTNVTLSACPSSPTPPAFCNGAAVGAFASVTPSTRTTPYPSASGATGGTGARGGVTVGEAAGLLPLELSKAPVGEPPGAALGPADAGAALEAGAAVASKPKPEPEPKPELTLTAAAFTRCASAPTSAGERGGGGGGGASGSFIVR